MSNASIARSARRLRFVVVVVVGLIAGLYVVGRLGLALGPITVLTHPDAPGWAGRAVTDLALLLFVVALVRLAQMLGAISEGLLFSPRVIRAFRGFAFWLFLATLVDVAGGPFITLLQAAAAGGGRTALVFELRDLLLLAGAMLLFLLARMLEQAQAIESELEEIV